MTQISETVVAECRQKLLQLRSDILNQLQFSKAEFRSLQCNVGDEADQTQSLLAENDILTAQARWQNQLLEVDLALSRIENGIFGICEETNEPIEPERLLALPWTRLSIEGAELREAMQQRYARS